MLSVSLSDLGATSSHLSLALLLVKATIILVAALGITMAMQRASAGARHLVWLVTLGTLIIMPALTMWGPLPLRVLPAREQRVSTGAVPLVPDADRVIGVSTAADAALPTVNASHDAPSMQDVGIVERLASLSLPALMLLPWVAVMLAIGVSLIWSALAVRRIVKNARTLDTPEWLNPLWEVADRFGLGEAPRLLRSDEAKMPFACGLLSPTIVLPAECEGWSLDRRRAVLLHELAHVRRHDLLGHALGRLVCAVYWFHPLVWTAARQLRSESERACDDLALSCGTRATDYAEHLLDIVTSVRRDATPSVALAMARRKEFEGRMLAILDPQLRRAAPSRRQTASLIATLAMISVLVGAAAPVPREARAAVVEPGARAWTTVPPASIAQSSVRPDSDVAAPSDAPFERDSRIHGIATRAAMSTVTSTSMATRTIIHQVQTPGISAAVSAGATAGAAAGAGAGAAAGRAVGDAVGAVVTPTVNAFVRSLLQSSGREARSDDRPILLAKVLRTDTSATLRRVAAWGLSEYADTPVAAEALANAVRHDTNAGVREMAAWALAEGEEGSASVLDALSAALKSDADTKVRATAAWALGNVGDRGATDALVAALADASPEVRTRALWAIGNVSPKQAPRAVTSLLTDKDARVRELAAWALYQIEDPSAAPALEAALRAESNQDLQLDYIRALAALGEKSVDAIRGLLESPDQRVKTMAVKALAGGHAAGPWPRPWPQPRPYP